MDYESKVNVRERMAEQARTKMHDHENMIEEQHMVKYSRVEED